MISPQRVPSCMSSTARRSQFASEHNMVLEVARMELFDSLSKTVVGELPVKL